ncbi:MAG: hypothetical protein M3443_18180 [Actinomycetota bacterium]|nr:hypothetical protein [Actinomycetota bacterium]
MSADSQSPRPRRRAVREFKIERIETVEMTDEQHRDAVHALAVLINKWREENADCKSLNRPPKPEESTSRDTGLPKGQ